MQRESSLGLNKMRPVKHFAVNADSAQIGIGIECRNDRLSEADFLSGWHEGCINNVDLSWVDGETSTEPLGTGLPTALCQTGIIAKVHKKGVDGLNLRRMGCKQSL